MERVSDYVINKLVQIGIEHVFMVTGRGILYLTDAVAKNDNIYGISTLHEQGASYAAMSYSKAKNSFAACLVSTGCAATNAITGALCAYQDNLPIIFISGQNMLKQTTRYTKDNIRTFGSQEADIISIVESITKYSVMITNPNDIVYEMEKSIHIANSGRKGPVWIDIPLDIQSTLIDSDSLNHFNEVSNYQNICDDDIEIILDDLNRSTRPIIFVGGGAFSCKEEIKELSEKYNIPVVYSFAGCDIYGKGEKNSIGAVGSLGSPRAGNFTVQNADYVLVIGSKMCSQTVGDSTLFARDAKITVVDIDENEHKKSGIKIDKIIFADAKDILGRLLQKNIDIHDEFWLSKCLHWKDIFDIDNESFTKPDLITNRIDLYSFASHLSKFLDKKTAIITDAGLEELIIPSTISYRGNQKCFFPASQGAMGYAIPAILGAYYGGYEDIIVVVGDGSIMMNIQELQLLNYLNIKAKIFIINNNMYSVIRSRQKDLFRKRTIGNDESDGVPSPDFKKLSKAFNLDYKTILDETELDRIIQEVILSKNSLLCEVNCKVDQKYFHVSYRKNELGKLVRPSIEDESPFMERELFLNEMIVEPKEC